MYFDADPEMVHEISETADGAVDLLKRTLQRRYADVRISDVMTGSQVDGAVREILVMCKVSIKQLECKSVWIRIGHLEGDDDYHGWSFFPEPALFGEGDLPQKPAQPLADPADIFCPKAVD